MLELDAVSHNCTPYVFPYGLQDGFVDVRGGNIDVGLDVRFLQR